MENLICRCALDISTSGPCENELLIILPPFPNSSSLNEWSTQGGATLYKCSTLIFCQLAVPFHPLLRMSGHVVRPSGQHFSVGFQLTRWTVSLQEFSFFWVQFGKEMVSTITREMSRGVCLYLLVHFHACLRARKFPTTRETNTFRSSNVIPSNRSRCLQLVNRLSLITFLCPRHRSGRMTRT